MLFLQQLSLPETTEAFEWFDKLSGKFLMRLAIDLLSVFVIVRLIYFRNYRRTDLFMTFFVFNLIIFLITFLLNKVEMSMGAAFGLFAVFSMLRYRTEGISAKDMTYLFLVIAIGLIMAISKGSWDDLALLAAIIIVITALLESNVLMKKEHTKTIIYDNAQLITEDKREQLLVDLQTRTGLAVHRVDIQHIDFLKDAVTMTMYYYHSTPSSGSEKSLLQKVVAIGGLVLLSSLSASAQTTETGLWTGISIEKKIVQNLSINLNGQHRLMESFSTTKSWIGEAGLSYKLFKGFEISAMYRYIYFNNYKPKKQIYIYEPRHRFYGDVSYNFKIKNFKINNRLRYQNQFKDDAGELIEDKSYLRYKIGLDYDTDTRFTPFLSSDLFYQLGGVGLDQVRAKIGLSTKITKNQSIDIAPFMNIPINDLTQNKELVIGVNYKLKF